ncbi:MAG: aminotransferase class I/II-fold pyridoxal phosphate-dependent enzyme [Promicromonosporaceae bacterium]|nr:aminotransferase class I/II-fold pyridoxal phosphate-dependent enzyme [Promicromonosporaceae bacterium]
MQTLADLRAAYDDIAGRQLSLDLTRGKPAAAQLDLSEALLSLPGPGRYRDSHGTDVRNYGGLDGLPELRELFAPLLQVAPENLLALSNASLTLMHDSLAYAWMWGVPGGSRPWGEEPTRRFICPTPGYDRHFALCEAFGIEMIPVPSLADGPDVEAIAALVAVDPTIKGMWLVPTYANPDGTVVSPAAARRLATMETAAPDFRIFLDNAYALHHLTEAETPTADLVTMCGEAGHPDRVLLFASTSKITFPGAGVAFVGGSAANADWYRRHLSKQSIGPDKVNQLRHLLFFRDAAGIRAHMARHREILAPKFAAVDAALSARFGGNVKAGQFRDFFCRVVRTMPAQFGNLL